MDIDVGLTVNSLILVLQYVVAYRAAKVVAAERRIGFTHSHNDQGKQLIPSGRECELYNHLTKFVLLSVNWDTFEKSK